MKSERRLYVHSPAYDHHNDKTITQLLLHHSPPEEWDRYRIRFDHRIGQSLLANAFNCGYQDFLNGTTDPNPMNAGPFDYFLLMASDVEPGDHFLHTMVEELESGGWDAMSAVVAIKDDRGITSAAVGQISNRWTEARKLTMAEID